MIYYFLLAASIVLAVCKSSLYNSYAKKSNPTLGATFRFNAISYGAAALIVTLMITGVFLINSLESAKTAPPPPQKRGKKGS